MLHIDSNPAHKLRWAFIGFGLSDNHWRPKPDVHTVREGQYFALRQRPACAADVCREHRHAGFNGKKTNAMLKRPDNAACA